MISYSDKKHNIDSNLQIKNINGNLGQKVLSYFEIKDDNKIMLKPKKLRVFPKVEPIKNDKTSNKKSNEIDVSNLNILIFNNQIY